MGFLDLRGRSSQNFNFQAFQNTSVNRNALVFSRAENVLELSIYGDIGYDIDEKELDNELSKNDFDRVEIRINSFGGDAWSGVTIYNRLKSLDQKVNVTIDGIAASSASIIAMAGDEIRVFETSMLLIHEPWIWLMGGNSADFRDAALRLDKLADRMAMIYSRKTGKSVEEMREYMKVETEFYGEEIIEMGLADTLLDSDDKPESSASEARKYINAKI